jgi:hypothetical protein
MNWIFLGDFIRGWFRYIVPMHMHPCDDDDISK